MRPTLAGLLFFVSSALFADVMPPYAALPAGFVSDQGREVMETFGREEFPPPGDVPPVIIEGRHYAAAYRADPPLELDGETTWSKKLRPAFVPGEPGGPLARCALGGSGFAAGRPVSPCFMDHSLSYFPLQLLPLYCAVI